jgi:hypothetical protein
MCFTPIIYKVMKVINVTITINVEVRLKVLTITTVKTVFYYARDIH